VPWPHPTTSSAVRCFLEVLDELAEAASPVLAGRPALQLTADGGMAT
jgi:hypothetical protein